MIGLSYCLATTVSASGRSGHCIMIMFRPSAWRATPSSPRYFAIQLVRPLCVALYIVSPRSSKWLHHTETVNKRRACGPR
ncbi:hypothetical protein J6590_040454 [Homalodisca vitripennis]|nr:hypothetical protein J6590_040454 [Homalodisca vitripennis]